MLLWNKCDEALEMFGIYNECQGLVTAKALEENSTYCISHRKALASKGLTRGILHDVEQVVVKTVNFVKAQLLFKG